MRPEHEPDGTPTSVTLEPRPNPSSVSSARAAWRRTGVPRHEPRPDRSPTGRPADDSRAVLGRESLARPRPALVLAKVTRAGVPGPAGAAAGPARRMTRHFDNASGATDEPGPIATLEAALPALAFAPVPRLRPLVCANLLASFVLFEPR